MASPHNPSNPLGRIALVAITRHGIAMAGRIAALLPEATLFAPEKFVAEAQAAAPGRCVCYAGRTGEQIPAHFAAFDAIVAVVSLGLALAFISRVARRENGLNGDFFGCAIIAGECAVLLAGCILL